MLHQIIHLLERIDHKLGVLVEHTVTDPAVLEELTARLDESRRKLNAAIQADSHKGPDHAQRNA